LKETKKAALQQSRSKFTRQETTNQVKERKEKKAKREG